MYIAAYMHYIYFLMEAIVYARDDQLAGRVRPVVSCLECGYVRLSNF